MTAFLLTWNPQIDWGDPRGIETFIRETARGSRRPSSNWSVAWNLQSIRRGDTFYMFRQKVDRGIVASGTFTGEIHPEGGHDYAGLRIERWLAPQDRLSIEELEREVPTVKWIRLQASGSELTPFEEKTVARLWKRHVGEVDTSPTPIPEEVAPGTYVDGAVTKVLVNKYERDPKARQACLDRWGYTCSVCDFDFTETYGELGAGFIHVHHLTELSEMKKAHKVDPVKDMRPVCPNCHAMLHRETPAMSIRSLKRLMRR